MSAVIIDATTGQTTTRLLTDAELAQQQADQAAAATAQAAADAALQAQAQADAADAQALATLYPQLVAQIPALADPQTIQTPQELAAVLADTLTALKGVVDRMRRKGL